MSKKVIQGLANGGLYATVDETMIAVSSCEWFYLMKVYNDDNSIYPDATWKIDCFDDLLKSMRMYEKDLRCWRVMASLNDE